MARTGQTLDNRVTGERITFLRTAADTDGALLEFELELAADGRVPGAHVHPEQEERFHVLEGTMTFRLGMRKVCVEVAPALDMEELLTTTAELAREGNVMRSGMPRPLHLALFVQRFRREVRAPFPPAGVVRAVMAPLAALARHRGYAARYDAPAPAPA